MQSCSETFFHHQQMEDQAPKMLTFSLLQAQWITYSLILMRSSVCASGAPAAAKPSKSAVRHSNSDDVPSEPGKRASGADP